MTAVIDFIIPICTGLSFFAVLFFGLRALASRSRMSAQAYGVGQQAAWRRTRVNMWLGIIAAIVVFILLVTIGIKSLLGSREPEPIVETAVPTPLIIPTALPTETPPIPATPLPSSTSPVPINTPVPPPTATATPAPPSATVNSVAGVWLRSEPSLIGEQLERLFQGEVVFLLPGSETVDEIDWQQIQMDTGLVGWVAREYITIAGDG